MNQCSICLTLVFDYFYKIKSQRMERQLFYIFYEDKNDVQFRLIKVYVNCFVIDEDAECEIIDITKIETPEIEFSKNTIIRKFQEVYSLSELIKISNLLKSMDESLNSSLNSIQDENYQIHCVFGASLDFDLSYYIVSIIFAAHSSVLLIRSENSLTEKDFRSIPRTKLSNEHLDDSNLTIGDDIDFFINKFKVFKPSLGIWEYIVYESLAQFFSMIPNNFLNQLERKKVFVQAFDYLGIFDESEQVYRKIECHRKFIPRQAHRIRSLLFMFVLTLAIAIGLIEIPTWYRRISKKILNFVLSYSSQSIFINFFLCFMTQLSCLFVRLKCFYYLKKFAREYIILLLDALIRIAFPNRWSRIVNILNLLLLCVYYCACYSELSGIERWLFKP